MWLSATDIHEDAGYYVFNFSTTHASGYFVRFQRKQIVQILDV